MRASRKVVNTQRGHEVASPFETPGAYWALDREAVVARLQSRPEGLSQADAAERLARVGPNQLRARPEYSRMRVLVAQVRSPLLLILVFAAVVSAFTGEWIDALIVLVIVFTSVGVSYSREYSAQTAVAALQAQVRTKANLMGDAARSWCPLRKSCLATWYFCRPAVLCPATA